MTSNIFNSSFRSLDRAKKHIADLEGEFNRFLTTKPWAPIVEPDTDGIHEIHKVKLTKDVPAEFSDIAADAVNNLRSALDHAGYAIAINRGIANPKSACFPFAPEEAKLDSMVRRHCKNLPDDIVALFRSFKPYKGGDDLLWALHEACCVNKHRLLTPVVVNTDCMYLRKLRYIRNRGPFIPIFECRNNEIVLGKIKRNANLQYNVNVSFTIAFNEVDVISGQPAIGVLNTMADKVLTILNATEAECRRIGIIN